MASSLRFTVLQLVFIELTFGGLLMLPATAIADTEFISFDVETTGFHPIAAQIVEIGAVRFRGDGTVLGTFGQLINPGSPIPIETTQIHGICDKMVARAPTLADVLPKFLAFVGQEPAVMLAHNARFDVSFLSVAIGKLGHSPPSHSVVDTCQVARKRLQLPNYKLETIGRHLRLIETEKHRALDDAMLLKDVFAHLVHRSPRLHQLNELLQLATQLGFQQQAVHRPKPSPGKEVLWQAMAEGFSVVIEYAGGSTRGTGRQITPRQIIEMNGQIYVSAYCHTDGFDKSFRLDRIGACRRSDN